MILQVRSQLCRRRWGSFLLHFFRTKLSFDRADLLARTRSNSYPRLFFSFFFFFFFFSFTIRQTDCGVVTFRENTFVLEGRSFLFLPTGLCESRSRLFPASLYPREKYKERGSFDSLISTPSTCTIELLDKKMNFVRLLSPRTYFDQFATKLEFSPRSRYIRFSNGILLDKTWENFLIRRLI